MRKFEVVYGSNGLNEVYQDVGLKFCAVSEKNGKIIQLSKFAKCRDYFTETVANTRFGVSTTVYGFSFDGTETPIDLDKTRLILKGTKGLFDLIKKQLKVLNKKEKQNKMELTVLEDIEGSNGQKYLYVVGDQLWSNTTVGMSFYTLIFRCMAQKDWEALTLAGLIKKVAVGGEGTNSGICQYINNSDKHNAFYNNMKKLFSIEDVFGGYGKTTVDNYTGDASSYHNAGGVRTFFQAITGPGYRMGDKIHKEMVDVLLSL